MGEAGFDIAQPSKIYRYKIKRNLTDFFSGALRKGPAIRKSPTSGEGEA
jgi:hypothetical protein